MSPDSTASDESLPMLGNIVTFILFIIGFPTMLFGAEWLVKGASRLAVAWGISPLAVGLTVVAYGTSMPECAVAVLAVWKDAGTDGGAADIAIGNVVGSNIANILLVLGMSAVVAPLIVSRDVVNRNMPLLIVVSLMTLAFAWDFNGDGRAVFTWWQGLIFVGGVFLYTWRAIVRGRAEKKSALHRADEIEQDFGHLGHSPWATAVELGRIAVGMVCLVAGAKFLVDGAVAGAEWLGVSKLVVSLTIVAIGTSLPEIATCVVAVLRGHRDLAVGNAVGSNIFNLLLVLGLSSVVAPGGGLHVSAEAMLADIPIMVGVAILAVPVFYTGRIIARWEGAMFLGLYVAYLVYLYLRTPTPKPLLEPFIAVMLWGVLPIIALVLFAQSAIHFNRWREHPGAQSKSDD